MVKQTEALFLQTHWWLFVQRVPRGRPSVSTGRRLHGDISRLDGGG